MSKKSVYESIKKQNGEAFAKAIRWFDSGIFDVPNLQQIVKYAGRNALPLLNYLESLKQVKILEQEPNLTQNPFELLALAGYDAFYADTLKKQNSIMDYYADMESLCTFRDRDRFKDYYIVHCIKKGAKELKRRDFKKPKRQDEYGTSVISIQILKTGGFISIKNRYNHTVEACDNTFNSNPDNIIAGLSAALKNYFHVDFSSQEVELTGNYLLVDGKIYSYHTESNNMYYGENYYIKDERVTFINPDYEMIIDDFIINFKENDIRQGEFQNLYDNPDVVLFYLVQKELEGKALTRRKEGDLTLVYADDRCVLKSRKGSLVYCDLKTPVKVEEALFIHHPTIEEVRLENCVSLDGYTFNNCPKLKKIFIPRCEKVLYHSFKELPALEVVEAENLKHVGSYSFTDLDKIQELFLPKLTVMRSASFRNLSSVVKISAPLLKWIEDNCLVYNTNMQEVNFPVLEELKQFNLTKCGALRSVNLPNLKFVGGNCLSANKSMQSLFLPSVVRIGSRSITANPKLEIVNAPLLKEIELGSFCKNNMLEELSLPVLTKVGDSSVCENENLTKISMPNLVQIGLNAFFKNAKLRSVFFDSLTELMHCNVFVNTNNVDVFFAPKLKIGCDVIRATIGKYITRRLKENQRTEG